ncbi:phage tail tube protein [Sphingobium sp. LSP13-1-1.1]|uniref:phage tail tube protein n=1 Tax=Sphingobium sp. LSP13-1-1.1 TaxID=3135234 RepID=UPI003423C8C2
MAATENLKLGKEVRVYIGKTASATSDIDFVKIVNENEVTMSYSVDEQDVSTKENGKVSLPGDESYEFKFTLNLALTDPSLQYLAAAKNKSWPYKVKSGANDWYEGRFILTGVENKAGSQGVIEGSYTLKNSGPVTENDPETGEPYGAA